MNTHPPPAREIPDALIDIASRLFCEVGYDGTTIDLLVSAGADPAEVVAAGGKGGLYRAVLEDLYQRENAVLVAVLEELTPDADGLCRLADAYLDFCMDNPQVPALWGHRWLNDAIDFCDLEHRYIMPLYRLVIEKTREIPSVTDARLHIATTVWCVHGFMTRGLFALSGDRRGADDPAAVARFREHLHHLVRLMTGPT